MFPHIYIFSRLARFNMTGSNSSVHGKNNGEDDVLVTRAVLGAEIDARLNATL